MLPNKNYIHRIAFIYACIVGAIPIVYNTILVVTDYLLEYYGDDPGGTMKQRAIIFALPVMIIVAIYHFKKKNDGFLKLKEGYIIGMEVAIISIGLMIAHHFIFNQLLAPNFHTQYYESYGQQRFEELVACCDYTEEQFEAHKNQRLDYEQGRGYIGDLVSAILIGGIISTIGGLIMRKKNRSIKGSS